MMNRVNVIVEFVAMICFCVVYLSVLLGVIDRFIIGYGFAFTGEVARFLFIWGAMLSAVSVTYKKSHYAVDYFRERWIRGKSGKLLVATILGFCILVCGVLVIKGFELTVLIMGNLSPALEISVAWVFAAIPVCAGLMAIIMITQLGDVCRGR